MTRTNKVLAGILLVQVALVAIVHTRGSASSSIPELAPIAPTFKADDATQLKIYGRDAKSDDAPDIALARTETGWALSSHENYPAMETKISSLLKQIEAAKTRRPLSTNDARQRQMGVADTDYERKVVVRFSTGETVLFVGTPAGRNKTAVRVEGESAIHGVAGLSASSFPTTAKGWVNTEYLKFDPAEIQTLGVSNINGSFEFSRAESGWTVTVNGAPLAIPADKHLATDTIDELATAAADITLSQPGSAPGSLGVPASTVTVQRKGKGDEAGAQLVIDIFKLKETITVHERQNAHTAEVSKTEVGHLVELDTDRLVTSDDEPTAGGIAPQGLPPNLIPPR